jgi:hypothetical protein
MQFHVFGMRPKQRHCRIGGSTETKMVVGQVHIRVTDLQMVGEKCQ